MSYQLHTTDRLNMAERIRVSMMLCTFCSNVRRISDASRLTSDYQGTEEIT